ncbi:MAG: cytochrome c [Armatimonadota bacterium]
MRPKGVNRLWAAAGVGTAVLAAAVSLAAPEPAPKLAPIPPLPLARGPIATYDEACARCHGPNGSFYGPTLGKGKTDAQLRQVIQEMAEGPSQLPPLPAAELEAQTAYHRALIKAEPFLAVTVRTAARLEGETTAGATVMVTAGTKTIGAKVEGSRWSAVLPEKGPAPIITARIGKTVTTLDTARASFSHTTPLATGGPKTKQDQTTESSTGQATK